MSKSQMRFNKTSFSFLVLYYWGKFLGINPVNLTKENQLKFSYLSLSYACFLCTIYCYVHYYLFKERLKLLMPAETPISMIVDFAEINNVFFAVQLTWLSFGFFQNRLKLIVKSFVRVEKISWKLDIPEDYEKHFDKLCFYIIFVNVLFISVVIWINSKQSNFDDYNVSLWVIYSFARIPSINALTIFVWTVLVLRRKFHRLNEKVRFFMLEDDDKVCFPEDIAHTEFTKSSGCNPVVFENSIDTIFQLRRELIQVVRSVKKHFDILILFFITSTLPTILFCIYLNCMYMKNHMPMGDRDFMFVSSMSCWGLLPVLALVVLSNVCGSALNEANDTGNILHAMLNNYEHIEASSRLAKFTMFSYHLLHNRLKMSLFGLFDINELMIFKIIGMVTMYFVIMLQFYN